MSLSTACGKKSQWNSIRKGRAKNKYATCSILDTRFEVHALLKRHGVPLRYTLQDLEDDRDTLHRLGL